MMAAPMARLLNWARAKSLWILPFGECACTDERTAACAAPGDLERWGARVFSPEPEQADLLLIGGRVALKMLPVQQQTYARMPESQWVSRWGPAPVLRPSLWRYRAIITTPTLRSGSAPIWCRSMSMCRGARRA